MNKSQVFTLAHSLRRASGMTMSQALKKAWREYRRSRCGSFQEIDVMGRKPCYEFNAETGELRFWPNYGQFRKAFEVPVKSYAYPSNVTDELALEMLRSD